MFVVTIVFSFWLGFVTPAHASSECLAIDSFAIDDSCKRLLGWGWTGGACEQISGCSTTDQNGNDLSAYLYIDEASCYASCSACPVVDPNDFGACAMVLGIAWTGSQCQYVSGCSTIDGSGTDRASAFYNSGDFDADMSECEQSCGSCPDLASADFGLCDLDLGFGYNGNECVSLSGCDTIDQNTSDDEAAWIFPTDEACGDRCEQCDVVDQDGFGNCKMLMGWAWTGASCEPISGCGPTDSYGVDWSGSFHATNSACLKDCTGSIRLYSPDPGQAGVSNTIRVGGLSQGDSVDLYKSRKVGQTAVTGCRSEVLNLRNPKRIATGTANAKGNVKFKRKISANLTGKLIRYQAVNTDTCEVSNLMEHTYF